MELFAPCIQKLKLTELTLPGTHDSGTYPASGISQPWVQTQYLNIREQLEQGIRALDLRLIIDGSGDNRFQICHDTYTFGLTLKDVLNQITSFLSSTNKEIVILDLHQIININKWSAGDYKEMANLIIRQIGSDKFIPSSAENQPLNEIWRTSGRVIVGSLGDRSKEALEWLEKNKEVPEWLKNNTPFWSDSVKQYWCGTSLTTWSSVAAYMQNIIDNTNAPENHLWSLMSQYNYTIPSFGKPAYVPEEISSFFSGLNGVKSNIISTDWWNRVNNPWTAHTEINVPNFSALICAVPYNMIKGYRVQNSLPLWDRNR